MTIQKVTMPRHSVNPELHKAIDSILNRIPVIAIYHAPQECGIPTVSLVSQQSGEILEKLEIPEDYYWSGQEQVEVCTPVRQFTEHISQAIHEPTLDVIRPKAQYLCHDRDHKFRPISITNLKYDPSIVPTWEADVLVEEYVSETKFEYHPDKDTFSQTMERQGIDMTKWPLPVRQKTDLLRFLREVLSSYKNYHLVNIIKIG